MNFKRALFLLFLGFSLFCKAQNPVLIGYWQNWNDSNAPYIPLNQIDSRYTVVCVAFAVPTSPSDMNMLFTPDGISEATFTSEIETLHSQGKKVLISIGGATASISLSNTTNRDAFVNSMTAILNTYHFDGIDIDIEHGDSILATGTISNPTSIESINLIAAINQIKTNYFSTFNTRMLLTFAPETAYVQGGMSAYGGIWGGYLPILDALRNDIDFIHVQLYNSGSMYGIDSGIYNQGTGDFIIAMTEALIQGFITAGGSFNGFPANKIVVGLPSCSNAAGGGFATTAVVASAVKYLMGTGPKPGNYTLINAGGYPDLGGMMTWSINWDKVTTCNATSYEYAANFEQLYTLLSTADFSSNQNKLVIAPNPAIDELFIKNSIEGSSYMVINVEGRIVLSGKIAINSTIDISNLKKGFYFLKIDATVLKFSK